MDRDIPIPQEILDAEAPCDCGYPMSAHQRPDWFCCDWRKKHDELAELVECCLACDSAYSGMRRDSCLKKRSHDVLYHSYHNDSTITGLGYRILMETRLRLLAALRKAVED
jgi:hypothetical protein